MQRAKLWRTPAFHFQFRYTLIHALGYNITLLAGQFEGSYVLILHCPKPWISARHLQRGAWCPDKLKKVRQFCDAFLLGPTVPGRGLSNENCVASSWGRLDNEDVIRLDLTAKIDVMWLKEGKPFNEASSNIIFLLLGEIVSTISEKRAGEMTKIMFFHQHDSASITKKLKNIEDEEKVSYMRWIKRQHAPLFHQVPPSLLCCWQPLLHWTSQWLSLPNQIFARFILTYKGIRKEHKNIARQNQSNKDYTFV